MTTPYKHGLYKMYGLLPADLSDIEQLAILCNTHEALDLKLNWDTLSTRPNHQPGDFLYYDHGKLVAFLGLYSFNSLEAEISGMVHPQYRRQGIFTALFKAALAECQRRKFPSLLLIVEHLSSAGQAFAASLAAHYHHSEYKMVLQAAQLPATFDPRLHFRQATIEDLSALQHITALAFGIPQQEVDWFSANSLTSSVRQYYVALLANQVIGKIDVVFEGPLAFIYGFGVLPEYRRQGYGRQILAWTIQTIIASGHQDIALEVAIENEHALGLYQSCGFVQTSRYDYYELPVQAV